MLQRLKKGQRLLIALITSASLILPSLSFAEVVKEAPSWYEMTGDALFVRPVLLVTTVVGAAIFVVTLPFSVVGGNVGEAAKTLVGTPGKATFVRCLGCTGEEMQARINQRKYDQPEQPPVMAPNSAEQPTQ